MKRLLRDKRFIVIAALLILGVPSIWLVAGTTGPGDEGLTATVKKGEFKVLVTTAGELRAKKFVPVRGPANLQQAEVYNGIKITTIVPEGTVVKEGDVVAELDRSPVAAKLADVTLALTKAQAVYEQAMLDSTLNLSKAREDNRTMELAMEEKRIAQEQAKYESPSVKRQAEIDLEKATRALAQGKLDYATRTEQAKAKMREVGADFERQKNKLKIVQDVMANFTIKAPSAGMVIYVKEWNGVKKTAGSQVSAWDPTIATLPDMTQMESITYVNEIDVRKVAKGQSVMISLDADPTRKLKGTVVEVANVGEQRPNADAKVFEVKVAVEQADSTLRPGMTTGNSVQTFSQKDALFVPLEAVVSDSGLSYVYRKSGSRTVKQEVLTGAINDNEVIIVRGLAENDRVLLSPPAGSAQRDVVHLPPGSAKPARPVGGGDTAVRPQQVNATDAKGARGAGPAPVAAPKKR
jgi:RND family efflux transporter MFP subunit